MNLNLKKVDKFKFHAQKILPLVFDESLSYYECLCKITAKLNELIDAYNDENQSE